MDLPSAIALENSEAIVPIDNHFKLYAGPGAGKTTFLTYHINRILAQSERLSKSRKVACITYTNIAVDTLKGRLKEADADVEISTIHSFLYKHIIKPYLWMLKDCPFPIDKLNGHDEIKLRISQLMEYKSVSKQQYIKNDTELAQVLGRIKWMLKDGELEMGFIKFYEGQVEKRSIKKNSYEVYKNICWKEGLLSHDDVLYFSYLLLQQEEQIREIIRAKFPYILIDEFQDTSPLQAEIIKLITQKESVLGVIGDPSQAIFSFQGTDEELFNNFFINGMQLYFINDNRRSTKQIIDVLNHMRKDRGFRQESPDNKCGEKAVILIGTPYKAHDYLEKEANINDFYTLAYKNGVAKSLEFSHSNGSLGDDIDLINFDGDRGWRIHFIIHAIEYGRQLKIQEAIKFMKKAYRKSSTFLDRDAFINLKRFLDEYDNYSEGNITEFNNLFVSGKYGVKEKISRGKKKVFYDSLTYKQMATSIKITDDVSKFKTIHKSKGDEFENVLVIAPITSQDKCLDFLVTPDLDKEEHRVYYVALSRAMQRLFINVPKLPKSHCELIKNLEVEVIKL